MLPQQDSTVSHDSTPLVGETPVAMRDVKTGTVDHGCSLRSTVSGLGESGTNAEKVPVRNRLGDMEEHVRNVRGDDTINYLCFDTRSIQFHAQIKPTQDWPGSTTNNWCCFAQTHKTHLRL